MSRLAFVVCFFLAVSPQLLARAQFGVIAEPNDAAATGVFDDNAVRTYQLTISKSDLDRIDARPSAEEWVRGTLVYNGQTYANVGVRYKGSVGGFLYPCTSSQSVGAAPGRKLGRCSIKIGLDKYNKDQRLHGLKTINLHAMGHDPSRLKERIGYGMFRAMGVAAPRAVHARVVINNKLEGVFLAVEQIDGEFTEGRFTDGGKGNLYKEVWPIYDDEATYRNALETHKGSSASKMVAFKRAIDSGASGVQRWTDRSYIMRYLAVDRVIQNDDGAMHWYCTQIGNNPSNVGNHNYYWYAGQSSDRTYLIPWDLDSTLGADASFVHIQRPWNEQTNSCGCGLSAQRPASCDRLTSIWATWKSDYTAAVNEFINGPFAAAKLDPQVQRWTNQLLPFIVESSKLEYSVNEEAWRAEIRDLHRIVNAARINRGYAY